MLSQAESCWVMLSHAKPRWSKHSQAEACWVTKLFRLMGFLHNWALGLKWQINVEHAWTASNRTNKPIFRQVENRLKNAITFSILYPQNNYFFVELLAKSLSPSVQKFGLVGDKITNQPLSKEEGAVSKNYRNYIIFKQKLFKLHFDFANN